MGYVPPPLPLSDAEFKKRWDAGARTLEELDSNLFRWLKSQEKTHLFQLVTIVIGIVWMIWLVA